MAAALLGAVAISVGSGAGAFSHFGRDDLALSAAALSLALVLSLIVLIRDMSLQHRFSDTAGWRGEMRKVGLNLDRLGSRLNALEKEASRPDTAPLVAELEALRQKLGDSAARQRIEPASSDPEPAPVVLLDRQLELYLEPIVALASKHTVHYRASMTLEAPDGRHVAFDDLARRLDAHALRPSLDIHCLARVLPLTRKLVLRRHNTLIFVPAGAETLANPQAMRELSALLGSDEGSASAVAFEIEHKAMAGLSAQGLEGLAQLARQGAALVLIRASPRSIDLAALRELNFAFLSFPSGSLPNRMFAKPEWSALARLAKANGLAVEVRGLDSEEQAGRARKWAELGSGSLFAPPRRVRHDAATMGSLTAAA